MNSERDHSYRKEDVAPPTQVEKFNSIFEDLHTYNSRFSVGSMLFMTLKAYTPLFDDEEVGKEKIEEKDDGKVLQGITDHQEMLSSSLDVIHGTTLDTLGLSLESVTGKTARIFYKDESAGAGEMRLNITDKNKFTDFLKGQSEEDVADGETRKNLSYVSSSLIKQIADGYNLLSPNDEALQLFSGMENVISEYKRLGLSKEVEKLEEYLEHARSGDLVEFVNIDRLGLMQQAGVGFGPADWQKDSSVEGLRNRWTGAIEALGKAKNNPRGQKLYEGLKFHLQNCATRALENVDEITYFDEERREGFRRELLDVKSSLEIV